ncbi:hypothetical protein DL546_001729 [Coniochaeta pulveracea]|uniref:MOSC domain-containing protein n=1 Tax=Coniochaeta pulveracea TaxID=177199 RepID=A0A420Y914_9PEZI|nr:hypothetical protein DL546_001729 [Coniochaeta pulveracea]
MSLETKMAALDVADVDLRAPFTHDTILEVRRGKMKKMPNVDVLSGICKDLEDGSVYIGKGGIEEDEHDYTFHGGPDKAVHGYCSTHYPTWQREFPEAAERFVPGAFGENFVTKHMNERNVCIGDVMAVGDDGVVLEVSLPRQPCFKLNHRFQIKNFAPNTWKTSRTGWYYRVVKEGHVKAGDEIRLVERKHPNWTIERIQEYLHRNRDVLEMNEELSQIQELGMESRGDFRKRVAKAKTKAKREAEPPVPWREFRVVEKRRENENGRILGFVLEAVEKVEKDDQKGSGLADELQGGSHAHLRLGNGLVRTYSVVGGDKDRFEVGVALEDRSRGGSKYLHEEVKVGDIVGVGKLTAGIPFKGMASNHIFVVGGVGVTAFLTWLEIYHSINYACTLHYAVRSSDDVAYVDRLKKLGDRVIIYDKSKGERMDIGNILDTMPWNSQLYFCGPKRLMDEAKELTKARGLAEGDVHFEAFEADTSGDPFEAYVKNKNKTLKVGEEETLLEVLKREFGDVDVASSCEVGNCGTCKIKLLDGRVEHRGSGLPQEEKATSMLSCISRGVGRIVVEI